MLAADLWSARRRHGHAKAPAYMSSPWLYRYVPADMLLQRPGGAGQPAGSSGRPSILALSLEMPKVSLPRFKNKDYLADRKPPLQHFYPQKLMITVAKGCIMAAAQPVHIATQVFVEELDDDDEEEREPVNWRALWRELFKGYHYSAGAIIFRNLSVTSIQRALEAFAISNLDPKMAGRLVKDVVSSAQRKAAKWGRYEAAWRMLVTSAHASMVLNLANLIYDMLQLGYEVIVTRHPQLRIGPPPKNPVDAPERMLRIVKTNTVSYLLATVGMAIGTYAYPGMGTNIGALLGDIAQFAL